MPILEGAPSGVAFVDSRTSIEVAVATNSSVAVELLLTTHGATTRYLVSNNAVDDTRDEIVKRIVDRLAQMSIVLSTEAVANILGLKATTIAEMIAAYNVAGYTVYQSGYLHIEFTSNVGLPDISYDVAKRNFQLANHAVVFGVDGRLKKLSLQPITPQATCEVLQVLRVGLLQKLEEAVNLNFLHTSLIE